MLLIDRAYLLLLELADNWLAFVVRKFVQVKVSSVKLASYPFVKIDLYLLIRSMSSTVYLGNWLSENGVQIMWSKQQPRSFC